MAGLPVASQPITDPNTGNATIPWYLYFTFQTISAGTISANYIYTSGLTVSSMTVSQIAAVNISATAIQVTQIKAVNITVTGGAQFLTTSSALTDYTSTGAGTITNAPAVGNPTKWIAINDNGTIRRIPTW